MRQRLYDYSFLALGIVIQIITYAFMPHDTWLSLLSGCLGICSVCLTAWGNIMMYVFGFAQVFTYTYLCISQRFYGEIAINAYYFITMIYGVYAWRKQLRTGSDESMTIVPRSMGVRPMIVIIIATLILSQLSGWLLALYTDDSQPYLDAYTTIPALVAQVLMIMAYRQHWYLWLAVDIVSVVLWLRAGDYCLGAQYAFWCANCLYGLFRWRSLGISRE